MGRDANDVLRESGPDALKNAVDRADNIVSFGQDETPVLFIGSDDEIATRVRALVENGETPLVGHEGQIYKWSGCFWQVLDASCIYAAIRRFDGVALRPGSKSYIKLNKSKLESIEALLYRQCHAPDFFRDAAMGIACENGFLVLSARGAELRPHAPDHRNRYQIACEWSGELLQNPKAGSLLERLLKGCLKGDSEACSKALVLQEVSGAALIDSMSVLRAPKAVILLGSKAANGKSQYLKLLLGLVPPEVISNLTPAQLADEKLVGNLSGKLLNVADEIGARAIAGETFKAVVTGDLVTARPLYQSGMAIASKAINVFATNRLPTFKDGMDRGVRRRLMIIGFDRVIPPEERLPDIGRLIATHELSDLLSWAVTGALRLIQAGEYTTVPSSEILLSDWIRVDDSLAEWIGDVDEVCCTGRIQDEIKVEVFVGAYERWCHGMRIAEHGILSRSKVVRRIKAGDFDGVGFKRLPNEKYVTGVKLAHSSDGTVSDE